LTRQKPLVHAMHALLSIKAAPPPEYVPTGHLLAATVAAPVPAGQKYPAVHGLCCVFASAEGQKKPGLQGFAVELVLAAARQNPAAQAAQAALDVAAEPPAENVPTGQAFAVADPVPAGQ